MIKNKHLHQLMIMEEVNPLVNKTNKKNKKNYKKN